MDSTLKEKINKIAIFGPHDRMNYGDFLFPIMIDHAISKYFDTDIQLKKYSLVNADFEKVGAFKSAGFNRLNSDIKNNKIDTILIAGGECLGASWPRLYSFISKPFFKLYSLRNEKKYQKLLSKLIRLFFSNAYESPFTPDKHFFDNKVKVLYNSVGGGARLPSYLLRRLADADYLAVRESGSFNWLSDNLGRKVYLYPDSAIILSDVFQPLPKMIDNYIYFQLSEYKLEADYPQVLKELELILHTTDFNILLGPIGIAQGHKDYNILNKLYKDLDNSRIYINVDYDIKNISSLIANSQCYVGTSLHGIITAMSYNVPYIGLNPKQGKVSSYLNTWAIDELNKPQSSGNFYPLLIEVLRNKPYLSAKIETKTVEQKKMYYESISNILNLI